MRIFVAINLPADMRRRLESAAEPLREEAFPVRWVAPANVHLTLKFLGEVTEERASAVTAAIDDVVAGVAPFQLIAEGFGAFPSPERPQVVWIGIELSAELRSLQERVERALAELGFPRENRSFHPHLTIGRARKGAARSAFRGLGASMGKLEYHDEFQVRSIDVMKSRLTPSGAIYSVLHSAELLP